MAGASSRNVPVELARLRQKLEDCRRDLREALEQQAATSEILRVIRRSPSDMQPVLNAVAESAARLCDADDVMIRRMEGDRTWIAAHIGSIPVQPDSAMPSLKLRTMMGTVARERRTLHVPDVTEPHVREKYPDSQFAGRGMWGVRTNLIVPLLREDVVIGAIAMRRLEVRPFSEKQIELLETFAAQAVIAIENVRLFNETKEALEQQTVISEILRVISSSPTDVQPVFDAIVKSGVHLFGGMNVSLRLVKGDYTEVVASTMPLAEADDRLPLPLNDDQIPASRSVLRREVVQFPDILTQDGVSDSTKRRAERRGYRAIVSAPLLRENIAIGAIAVARATPGVFTDKQVALLKTFADQAVIAIENVRLFNETKEALEQQTVISEILRVISSSPTDVQPVFDAIVKSGVHLFGGLNVSLRLVKGDHSETVAGTLPLDATGGPFPVPLGDESIPSSRALLRKAVVQVADTLAENWISPAFKQRAERSGFRAVMSAPMMRDQNAIGTINVSRATPGIFSDKQVALLKTFADQAVIAIENVRLFNETKEALERQTATAEILQVISGSPTDVTPVLEAVTHRAAQLCEAHDARLFLVEGNALRNVAGFGEFEDAYVTSPLLARGSIRPLNRGNPMGRAIIDRVVLHVEDIAAVLDEYPGSRVMQQRFGHRTTLAVPLLRDDRSLGAILIRRKEVRPFTDKQIKLLETFAAQAVIAIENVRLFNETKEALEQQTATAEVLRVISSSPTSTEPVFDAILRDALRLCDASLGAVGLYDGKLYEHVAQLGGDPEYVKWLFSGPFEAGPGYTIGQMVIGRQPVHVPDYRQLPAYINREPRAVATAELGGARTYLAVPMLKDGRVVGGITIRRAEVRPFTQKQIDLLSTFANQAVIAIENVRLFKEIQDKSRQLEVASRHKSDFLAHMSHELRTPLNAIIGFSEALLARMFGEVNPKQDEYLRDIHTSGHHLLSLINDILDLAKVEAGRMDLELSEFDLPTALRNAMTLVRERAQNHGIALELRLDSKLGAIRADERKVKQIVLNLLSNAVKFTPDGGRVEVDARSNDASAEISVKDTGAGIAPEDQATLFEEFRQVGRDYTTKHEGTGLGLALTRRFVELHGGKISLQSAPGQGAIFTFTLPLTAVSG